ncbi:MAG: aspartate-semialdehyde dehydrogenase [Bacillota bacterium]
MPDLRVAIVGVTGAVGRQFLTLLEQRGFPLADLVPMASARSAGQTVQLGGREYQIQEAAADAFAAVDLAFFCANTQVSRELAPQAVARGAVVIDKSNAFRMDPAVPLVVPEVNPNDIHQHQGIIASPNCSTIQMVVALEPIRRRAGLKRIVVSTYQAVSGSGLLALQELISQSRAILEGQAVEPVVYPHQIAFNVLPHIDTIGADGYSGEEMKMVRETRKIMGDEHIEIAATTVRVPVLYGHSESIWIETEEKVTASQARQILMEAGVKVLDDPSGNQYPLAINCAGSDDVCVGRIREDLDRPNGLLMWVVADNLRKGAATNAIQIAEYMLAKGLLPT